MSDKPQIQYEKEDDIRYWYFPSPIKEQRKTDYQNELYFRNVVYLLQLHIEDKKNLGGAVKSMLFFLHISKIDIKES